MKIKDIPEYVLNPRYKMTHIMAAEVEGGLFQYRRCFPSKGASTRRLNEVRRLYPHIHFEVTSIEDIKNGTHEQI